MYILGLNPGGNPEAQVGETVARSLACFRSGLPDWPAYSDESWNNAMPGTWGMQPRVLHMLDRLGLEPRQVPASNVVFARSATEAALEAEKAAMLRVCWPVHRAVIEALEVRIVACFGGTADQWVREALGANLRIDAYREDTPGTRCGSSSRM